MVNIEEIIIAYLSNVFDIETYADVPKEYPVRFVTVERTGGIRDSLVIDRPMVAVQCWAETRRDAADFAYKVDDALRSLPAHNKRVTFARRNSLYNFPDPESKKPRYQLVYEFVAVN